MLAGPREAAEGVAADVGTEGHAIDREHLEERLVAFEKETGCRIGITETDPDPSYSAFKSTTIRPPATAASKLAVEKEIRFACFCIFSR